MIRFVVAFFASAIGGLFLISLAVFAIALKFAVIGFVLYFFLAMAGVFPPVDYIPFIPYI